MMSVSRRTLLMLSTAAAVSLAGCSTDEQPDPNADVAVTAFISGPTGRQRLFEESDIAAVGSVRETDAGAAVPVELTEAAAAEAAGSFETVSADEQPSAAEVEYQIDGDIESERTLDVSPDLADSVANGQWDGEFLIVIDSETEAETVQAGLQAG